jgi:hypothetical protein
MNPSSGEISLIKPHRVENMHGFFGKETLEETWFHINE